MRCTGARRAVLRLALVLAPFPVAAQEGGASFEEGLAQARGRMDARDWSAAGELLRGAVTEHHESDALLVRWAEVSEALARCAFWAAYDPPEPEDVVTGELLSWKPKTGDIKLRYRRERGDFGGAAGPRSGEDDEDAGPVRIGDFNRLGETMYVHPVLFKGPYRIAIEGESQRGGDPPTILVAWRWDSLQGLLYGQAYFVAFWPLVMVGEFSAGEPDILDSASTNWDQRRPYEFRADVAASSISAYVNGKRVLKTKRPKGEYGQFGFLGIKEVQEVTVTGEVEPAWIVGLIDDRIQADWRAFRVRFDPFDGLPEGLAARVRGSAPEAAEFGDAQPQPTHLKNGPFLTRARAFHDDAEFEEGLEYVEALREDDVTPALRAWLLTHFLAYNGKLEEALERAEELAEADPHFYEGRLHRVQLLAAVRGREAALYELEQLLVDFPEYLDAYEALVAAHLYEGRLEDARTVLGVAVANDVPPQALEKLGRNLLRSEHGPRFGEAHTYESKNFVVVSDLSRDVCYDVAQELEKFHQKYVNRVRRPGKGRGEEKARVYFFAGKAGYSAYTEDLLGSPAENTLGLYSPWLKQLVIWNSPDRRMVMRTVRHEGFHQYLDRITGEAPVWLNEGMAEYFEQARLVQGRWKDDQVNEAHVALLLAVEEEWTPLRDLVYMDARAFRARSGLHYPQSWALVHFLANGGRKNERVFDELLGGLYEGLERREALDRAFEKVDWESFESEFRAYLYDLRR